MTTIISLTPYLITVIAIIAVIIILTMGYVKAPPDIAFLISGLRM